MSQPNAENTVSRNVRLMRRMRRCGGLLYHRFQLNFSQNRILLILSRHEVMTQKALMDEMGIQAGSLSEMLSKVEQGGLVEKNRLADDKRNFEIRLTPEGKKQAEIFKAQREDMAEFLFCRLTEEEKTQLSHILDKLLEHWENTEN